MRFQILSALVIISGVAVWLALETFAEARVRLIIEILVLAFVPGPLATAVLMVNGRLRAFAIGALVPPLLVVLVVALNFQGLYREAVLIMQHDRITEVNPRFVVHFFSRMSLFWLPVACLSGVGSALVFVIAKGKAFPER